MCGVEFKNGVVKAFPILIGLFIVEVIVGVVFGVIPILA